MAGQYDHCQPCLLAVSSECDGCMHQLYKLCLHRLYKLCSQLYKLVAFTLVQVDCIDALKINDRLITQPVELLNMNLRYSACDQMMLLVDTRFHACWLTLVSMHAEVSRRYDMAHGPQRPRPVRDPA